MKNLLALSLLALLSSACGQKQSAGQAATAKPPEGKIEKITLAEDEWKARLSKEEYYVLREMGTERAFANEYWDNKAKGTYLCGGCQLPLFSSETKYTSGTGWPSFYQPINAEYVAEAEDKSAGITRTEVHCARCGGHLGHIFPDGPEPTGLRYCLNSAALDFEPAKEKDQ